MASLPNPFGKSEPKKTPVDGFGENIKNIAKNNYRGLLGVFVPLCALAWQVEKENKSLKLQLIWMWMFWFCLTQPISIPCSGLIPIFAFPMGGVMSTDITCKCYMNESVMLYILGSMLVLLLNNSGVDRRIAVWFICSGDDSQYSGAKLVYKCGMASFFLSMFSSRLIATATITQIMTNAIVPAKGSKDGANTGAVRDVICNAIQTSSSIGGTAILHASYATIVFRGAFAEFAPERQEYPDIFNFLQYSAFAFPVAAIMFVINLAYHIVLVGTAGGKAMSGAQMTAVRGNLSKNKLELPPISLHEKLSVVFAIIILLMHLFRWNPSWIPGWAQFSEVPEFPVLPKLKDATTCAIFLILLCIIPKGYGFLGIMGAKKKSNLPPLKPESPILWWRFIDKNINYGYIFTIGSCYAILHACSETGLGPIISANMGLQITGLDWAIGLFACVLIASILANIMTSLAALAVWLPFVLSMSSDAPVPWPTNVYIAALGVGMACSYGFCCPFQYTPAYYCHNIGKVPILTMTKYSVPSVVICTIILYAGLLLYAPILWDPNGFTPVDFPGAGSTTEAGGGGGGEATDAPAPR